MTSPLEIDRLETELIELVLLGGSVSGYQERFNELRNELLLNRLPAEKKHAWQAAYLELVAARHRLDLVAAELGVADLNLAPWKREIQWTVTHWMPLPEPPK
jgi:hypothetical protein